MRNYELSVLFHPDLEMNPDPAFEKVRKTIEQVGGKVLNEENEGKKRLAYKIGSQNFALYYYADVSLPSDAPEKINSTLGIADEVIRCLLVRTDERKAKYAEKRAEAEAREAARTPEESEDSEETKDTNEEEDN